MHSGNGADRRGKAHQVCPDCPATRVGSLLHLITPECQFRCQALEARAPIPLRWFDDYKFGLVRRGVLIRQRADRTGECVAVDAAGPGCLVPLAAARLAQGAGTSTATGYAATDTLVCLIPADWDESDPRTSYDLVTLQRAAIARVEHLSEARGRATSAQRVRALLDALADHLSPPERRNHLPAGLQQRDLAHLLGMRHETVCRVLGDMEKRGLVERSTDGLKLGPRSQTGT